MRNFLSIALAVVVLCFGPSVVMASESHGHNGHGTDGGHSGGEGGGHDGGNGHNGGGTGGTGGTSAPSVSVDAPSVSTPDGGGTQVAEGRGVANYEALRACTSASAGFSGLVDYRILPDGSFLYWGVEYALPTFAQCMKDRGVQVSTAGRDSLTNFGSR